MSIQGVGSFIVDVRIRPLRMPARLPIVLTAFLLLISTGGVATAQEVIQVAGRVVDAETGEGLAGVSVFVANTTLGAATDETGRFEIRANATGIIEMVASAIGYAPLTRTVDLLTAAVDSLTFRLQSTSYALAGVSVEAERPRGWRRDLEHFTALFLGPSDHAKRTILLNPYVLEFSRDGNAFVATASEPLQIENRALGYRINYLLGRLFEGRESASQYVGRYTMSYTGQVLFEAMESDDPDDLARWATNRSASFEGSLQHFLWALTRNRLTEEGFELTRGYESDRGRIEVRQLAPAVEPESLLTPSDRPGYFVLRTEHPLVVRHRAKQSLNLLGLRIPLGTSTNVSTITLRDRAALVHVSGYAHSPTGPHNPLAVSGSMSRRRVADMLPRDYVRIWEASRPADLPIASRKRGESALHGLVVDAISHWALSGVQVRAISSDGTMEVRTSVDGGFELSNADEVIALAPGYLPARVPGSETREGELRIEMMPIQAALISEKGFGSNLAFPSAAEAGPIPSAQLGAAVRYIRARDWKRAEDALGSILQRDSTNIEARYFRAIAARERGKLHLPLQAILPGNAVDRSRRDFEILARSHGNYRDVLFQHALLEWYDGRYERAVELAHAQVLLKPELTWARIGLFRLGQSLLHHLTEEEFDAFLASRRAPYFEFLKAESARIAGRLEEADRLLARLGTSPALPEMPVRLARTRIAFARGEDIDGERLLDEAIAGIVSRFDAWFLMEDVKVLLDPGEFDRFAAISTPAEYARFFRGFWLRRDPDRARAGNRRIAEHYARLAYSEKNYYFDGIRAEFNTPEVEFPATTGAPTLAPRVEYPDAYWLNHAFDDRGLIHLRHGQPDEQSFAISADRSNVSWRYYGDGTPVDFHFVVAELGAHDNWRLVPYLPPDMIASRASWGHPYNLEVWNGLEILHQNQRVIDAALTTDTHEWSGVERLDLPHRVALFRGEEGRTLLRLYYVLPGADSILSDPVQVSLTAHDRNWNEVYQVTERPEGAFLLEAAFEPDTLHMAFDVAVRDGQQVAAYRWSQVVRDFRPPSLSMSDVVVLHALAADREDAVRWANPTGVHHRASPLHLYFELYGLAFDGTDHTSYEIEYQLAPLEERRGILGLGRGRENTLSVKTSHTGIGRDVIERGQIDVSGVRPGEYRLQVTVVDGTSGAETRQSLDLQIR